MSEHVENQGTGGIDIAQFSTSQQQDSVDDVVGEAGDASAKDESSNAKKQPGWIQQRIEEGVSKRLDKALAEFQTKIAAEYEAKYRPVQERLLGMEADELVKSGAVKTKEIALEYLRLKNGLPVTPVEAPKPERNEKGQFAPKADPTEERARMLMAQAKSIKRQTGVDVLELFNSDLEVKRRVSTGEMDFDDVAEAVRAKRDTPGASIPTPMRSPNSGAASRKEIKDFSDRQFDELLDFLGKGGTINTRQ